MISTRSLSLVALMFVTASAAYGSGPDKRATLQAEAATLGDAAPEAGGREPRFQSVVTVREAPPDSSTDPAATEPKTYMLMLAVFAAVAFVVRRRG